MQTRREFLSNWSAVGAIGVSKALFPAWMPRRKMHTGTSPGATWFCWRKARRGGIDGLSAVAPYGDGAHYYDARPTLAVPEPGPDTSAALDLDGYFGFHPALAPLKDIYGRGTGSRPRYRLD